MTSSFAPRIKSSYAVLLTGALCLCLSACDKKAEPQQPQGTQQANATVLPPNAQAGPATNQPASIPNSPHGGEFKNPHSKIPMAGRPDLRNMPNDAVHAPYRQAPMAGPHAGMGGKVMPAAPETDGHETLPLVKSGPRSSKELEERLALEKDPSIRERLEKGFRMTFSTKKSRQTAAEAAKLLEGLESGTSGATAYRILAYVAILTGVGFEQSQKRYAKAVQLDPNYGAAHYGLAFSLLWSPTPAAKARGREHFETAMKLGVEDTNNLRGRFYPNAGKPKTAK